MSLVADTTPTPQVLALKRLSPVELNRLTATFVVTEFDLGGPYAVIRLDASNILCINLHRRLLAIPEYEELALQAAQPLGRLACIRQHARNTYLALLAKERATHQWRPLGSIHSPAYLFKSATILGANENISMISDW